MAHLALVALIVRECDPAICFFAVLAFELIEDVPSLTNDGGPMRWVVVRRRGAHTGILLAREDGDVQTHAVGSRVGERAGFFLHVDDSDDTLTRLRSAGAEILCEPRTEPYCGGLTFRGCEGNKWDLLGAW